MNTIPLLATIALGILALIAAAGILLVLLDDGTDLAVRPIPPDELESVSAGSRPGVPVSPTLHHYAEGRVPVTGRVAAPKPRWSGPRHAAAEDTHDWSRAPRVLVARLNLADNWRDATANLVWSTL